VGIERVNQYLPDNFRAKTQGAQKGRPCLKDIPDLGLETPFAGLSRGCGTVTFRNLLVRINPELACYQAGRGYPADLTFVQSRLRV